MESPPWAQLYPRRPLLTGCVLWPAKAVCTSAADLLELCLSAALLPLFICVHLSLHVAPATTLSVLISLNSFSLLSLWPLGALLPAALDLSGTLGVAGKKWCSQMPDQKQMELHACLGNSWSVTFNVMNRIKAVVETFHFYLLITERCTILTWRTHHLISFVSLKWQKPPR